VLATYTQLRLARTAVGDFRRPWERPALHERLTPAPSAEAFDTYAPKPATRLRTETLPAQDPADHPDNATTTRQPDTTSTSSPPPPAQNPNVARRPRITPGHAVQVKDLAWAARGCNNPQSLGASNAVGFGAKRTRTGETERDSLKPESDGHGLQRLSNEWHDRDDCSLLDKLPN
jgi:hypothetical protein